MNGSNTYVETLIFHFLSKTPIFHKMLPFLFAYILASLHTNSFLTSFKILFRLFKT